MNKTILNMLFSVVAVCETWLHKSNSDLFNIPGYHFISNSREHKLGGGVGLYIQSDMNFKPRIDLQSSDNSLYQSVFVEIMRPHVFSHFNHLLPASLSSLLHFNRDFHDYLTRSRFNLHKMSLRYQFAISSQAPTIWNDIPLTVRDSLTTSNFKKKLKLHFLSLS